MTEFSVEDVGWLERQAQRILRGARIQADDGTEILTPAVDGYKGLWARDLEYACQNAPEWIDPRLLEQCYRRLLRRQRGDGALPVAVDPRGTPHYLCWGDSAMTDSDTAQFAVKLAYDHFRMTGGLELFAETADCLIRGMNFMPRDETGLIWIDPERPHTPYGFTDCVVKTGQELFCSILYWEASRRLAEMLERIGRRGNAETFIARADRLASHLDVLWEDSAGMFLAASHVGRNIDVWGNAYAVYVGLPMGRKTQRICKFLAENYDRYSFRGQIRHLVDGDFWEQTRHSDTGTIPEQEYQNGAYWGTASGWIGYALAQIDPALSSRHFSDLIDFYRNEGVYECVGRGGYRKMKDYVASVVNPLGAIRRLRGKT